MDENIQLAMAIAKQHAAFGKQFNEAAAKQATKFVADKATLAELQSLYQAHAHTLGRIVASLPPPALTKLLRRLDPHNPAAKTMAKAAATPHVNSLVSGQRAPATAPVKVARPAAGRKTANVTTVSFSEAVRLPDASARLTALKSLSAPTIKSGIKAEGLHPEGMPRGAGKDDLIRHIEKTIRMGWPGPLDIMAVDRH